MAIYVGDSLFKDVVMAQKAGVADVYAHYGKAHTKGEYELLRAVTHWPSEDVENEKKLTESDCHPTFTIDGGFSQLLALSTLRDTRALWFHPLKIKLRTSLRFGRQR